MNIVVSSWALHRALGISYPDSPATGPTGIENHHPPSMSLEELPARLREREFFAAELCHFHLPGTDVDRLREMRSGFERAGVRVQSVLIDDGDPSHPEFGQRDTDWIKGWIGIAAELGAERARIIAGKQPFDRPTFERALARVSELAQCANSFGVRLTTENWFPLLASAEAVNELLDRTDGNVGLCADFGNWQTPRKYTDLPKILPRAETCHAKCEFEGDGSIDIGDFERCLNLSKDAGFDGPLVLVNGGPGNEWDALQASRQAIVDWAAK